MAACVKTSQPEGYVAYDEDKPGHGNSHVVESLSALKRGLRVAWGCLALLAATIVAIIIALIVVSEKSCDGDCEAPPALVASDAITILSSAGNVPDGYISRGAVNGATGSWVTAAQFPAPAAQGISDGSAVVVGDTVYHVGGHVGNAQKGNVLSAATFIYDPLTASFTPGTPLPIPAARGAAASDGTSTVYYTAGVTTGGGHAGADGADCLFSLDTSADVAAWTSLPCMAQPRSDHCAAWINGKLYVAGGYTPDYGLVDSIEVYDPASKTWADAGVALPGGRGDVQCTVVGDKLYLVGGINKPWDEPPETWYTTEVLEVDVAAKTAGVVTQLPGIARGDVAIAAVSPTEMIVAGGEIHAGGRTQVGTHSVFLYDTQADTWVEKAPMPNALFRAAAVGVPSRDGDLTFAVFGGHHLCETAAAEDNPDDDGGCDEISAVRAFIDAAVPSVFALSPDPDVPAVERAPEASISSVIVSPLPAVTGYRLQGAVSSGGGFWTTKTTMDVARSDFHAHTVAGKIYLVGGLNGRQAGMHHVDVYDPVLDTYTKGPQTTAGQFRLRYASAVIGTRIFVAGGLPQSDAGADVSKLDTLLIYSTETRNYTQGARMSGVRSDHCAAAVGSKIYVAGGWDVEYNTLRSVEVYDSVADSWAPGPSLPEPRGDCMAVAYDGVVYVAGGFYDPEGAFAYDSHRQTLYALDTKAENPQWQRRAPVPVARGDAALVVLRDGRLLHIGGETHARAERTEVATHEVYEYIIRDDIWVAKAPLPLPRFRVAAAAYNGAAYVFGGQETAVHAGEGDNFTSTAVSSSKIQAFFDVQSEPFYLHAKV